MKSLFLILTFLFIVSGVAQADEYRMTERAGGYSVEIAFDKGRPVLGVNPVGITVTDAASRPVTGARVKIDYFMPSLPGKVPMMERSATARPVDGKYEATMDLTMKGEWKATFSIIRPNETEKVTFEFEVR